MCETCPKLKDKAPMIFASVIVASASQKVDSEYQLPMWKQGITGMDLFLDENCGDEVWGDDSVFSG